VRRLLVLLTAAALLPDRAIEEAGGAEEAALGELAERTGQEGTYAGVIGNRFRAGSTVRRDADEAADAAFERAGSQGVAATLLAFVDELDDPGATGGTTRGFPEGSLLFLGAIVGGVGLMALASRRRRRKELEQEVAELRAAANDDLVALGEDVRAVDLDVEMPGVDPRAKEHLGVALAAYEEAETAIPRAEHPDEFEPIAARIDEGRFAMQAVRALLAGQPVPERRPPCFFDPRHGPSVAEVHWAPNGYEPRPVPVCAADELRLESGRDPDVRHVLAGGRQVPLYDAPAYFSPYAGGFFGMATGFMLPGLLFGGLMGPAMLGGGLFGGPMLGGGFGGGFGDGGGGGFDVGGGDFGGDFGGGGDF
jgi:hypothetical protein